MMTPLLVAAMFMHTGELLHKPYRCAQTGVCDSYL